jgi:hypothetical protein
MKHIMDRVAHVLLRPVSVPASTRSNGAGAVLGEDGGTQDRTGRGEPQSSSAPKECAPLRQDSASHDDRRSEPRHEEKVDVILTPLDDVSKRLRGITLNVSNRGVRVRLDPNSEQPNQRQVYRIETGANRILCEVRNSAIMPASVEVGFEILSRPQAGKASMNKLNAAAAS